MMIRSPGAKRKWTDIPCYPLPHRLFNLRGSLCIYRRIPDKVNGVLLGYVATVIIQGVLLIVVADARIPSALDTVRARRDMFYGDDVQMRAVDPDLRQSQRSPRCTTHEASAPYSPHSTA